MVTRVCVCVVVVETLSATDAPPPSSRQNLPGVTEKNVAIYLLNNDDVVIDI